MALANGIFGIPHLNATLISKDHLIFLKPLVMVKLECEPIDLYFVTKCKNLSKLTDKF